MNKVIVASFVAVALMAGPVEAASSRAAAIVLQFTGPDKGTRNAVLSHGPNARDFDLNACQAELQANLGKIVRDTKRQPAYARLKFVGAQCMPYSMSRKYLK
jgi:hypothetical protein